VAARDPVYFAIHISCPVVWSPAIWDREQIHAENPQTDVDRIRLCVQLCGTELKAAGGLAYKPEVSMDLRSKDKYAVR